MTDRPSKVREIFDQAAEIASADERRTFLDSACAGDADLRCQVDALLKAHTDAGSFLDNPALDAAASSKTEMTEAFDQTPGDRSDSGGPTRMDSGAQRDDDPLSFLAPSATPGNLGRLGHYEIQAVIGKGGFGTVLKAFDERLHRIVAIKVLAPELAASGIARSRFLREAMAGAAVTHEHVVTIHAVEQEHRPPYIVMQMIDGVTLQQKMDNAGVLSLKEILRIGMQMAEGLAAAHKQGLVHRDIKPANILLENGIERVKISDFGLARAVDDASVTQSGTVAGTPMYMSPEQAEGLPIDHRSDLFSLGTVLYAMCTGHPPFRASGTHAVLKRVIDAAPRPIREVNNEIPDWLADIIAKLHAKKPEDRFQTAKEVAELLGQHLADVQAGRAIERQAPVEAPTPATRVLTRHGARWRRIGRKWKWAAAVLLVVVLGSAVAAWFIPPVSRYVGNRAELAFDLSDPDFERALVYSDEEVVADVDLHSSPTIKLAPGQYKLVLRTRDSRALQWWRYDRYGLNHGRNAEPLVGSKTTFGLDVVRGERVVFTARLEPPEPRPDPGWVQLFNGKDIHDWKAHPDLPGKWKVKDGVLVGSGQLSHLFKKIDFDRFHLRAKVQISDGAEGAILFRIPEIALGEYKIPVGHMVQINSNSKLPMKNGALTILSEPRALRNATLPPPRPGEWFTLEIISDGGVTETRVNGKQTVFDVETIKRPPGRYIALQSTEHPIQFKNIEIKELPGTPSEPPPAARLATWGTFVDPRGECTLMRAERVASIRVPGTRPYNLLPTQGFNLDAPRLVQELEGDFLIQTTVVPYERPKPKTATRPERPVSFRAAGLLVWVNEQNFLRFERASYGEAGDGAPYLNMEWYIAGRLGNTDSAGPPVIPDAPTHLQIERRGQILLLRRSDDGITWTDAKMVHNIVLPERVSVGLVASNSTNTELTAAFDNLHLRGKATSPEAPGAWVQLFNGKDLTNWNPHPNWRVEKNILVGAGPLGPGKNAFLATERVDYADFHLRAEVRVHNQEADGGIFVRSNFHEKLTTPSWCEANIGFGPKRQKEHTGSLAVHKVNAKAGDPWIAAPADLAKPGEWFVLEVIAIGQHITSKVNGKIAAETRNAGVHPRGQIVLQAFGEKTVVQFKTVEIKELPPEEPGWVHLFNGKDLTGWENAAWAKTPWIVENGNLVGKGHTALTFDKAYKNFHCRLEAKINDGAWSALHFRRAPSGDVCTVIAHQHNTGGLWFVKHGEKNRRLFNPTKDDWATPDTWLTVEVIAINQNVTILVNGAKTTEMKVEEMAASGGLMLISGAETTTMTVRKIEIKELPPEEPGWVQLFNGKDLSGWQGDPDVWSWKDDLLIGTAVKKDSDKGNAKGFDLRSEKSFKDFELKFKARLDSFGGLAGVLFRGPAGMPIAPTRQMGKFEPRYTVAKSGKFLPGTLDWNELEKIIKPGFNHFHLRCEGKRVTLKLNGITTLDNEAVPELADEGPIVFRVYWASNTTTSVSFRDIRIREIKSPE